VVDILLLHGPNLSQLGSRDPEHYGTATLDDVEAVAQDVAEAAGAKLTALQTEHEGELVERLHAARTDGTDAVVINAGAWSHDSYAIRDALELLDVPKVESTCRTSPPGRSSGTPRCSPRSSMAKRRRDHFSANASSSASCRRSAVMRSWSSSSPSPSRATAVSEPLCGSIPIMTSIAKASLSPDGQGGHSGQS